MTKKKEGIFIIIGIIISIILIFAIFKLNKYYDDKHQEEIALEMEERAKEEERLEKIELEKKKAEEERKKEETAKLREQFRKDAEKNKGTSQGNNQGANSNTGTGKVPEPEVKQMKDNNGNNVTVTKVPKINPNSVPDEVEKPVKQDPSPVATPPKDQPNAKVEKPVMPRIEGKNETVYPDTKASEENKNNKNSNTGNSALDNFLNNIEGDPSGAGRRTYDINDLPENEKPGNGDKF